MFYAQSTSMVIISVRTSWFKQNFIRDKIKIQRIIMCSSTSYSYSLWAMSSYIWRKKIDNVWRTNNFTSLTINET